MEQDRALRVLEFTKIRERLAAHALTDMGREKCLALRPYDELCATCAGRWMRPRRPACCSAFWAGSR